MTEQPPTPPWQPPPAWQPVPPWQAPPAWQPPPPTDLPAPVPPAPVGPAPAHEPPGSRGVPRAGLLVGLLVLVLLAGCGGLAFASWRLIGPDSASTAAGPSVRPTTPAPGTARGDVPNPAGAVPSPSPAGPSAVPAGSAAVPFGTAHTVSWPDHLVAYVLRARHYNLPEDQLATHPGDVSVGVEVKIVNDSAVDVVVTPARMRMWYGPDHTPADHYDGSISHTGDGFFGVVHPGHTADGGFSFAVPPRYLTQLVIELVPRPGDAPALFAGSVD